MKNVSIEYWNFRSCLKFLYELEYFYLRFGYARDTVSIRGNGYTCNMMDGMWLGGVKEMDFICDFFRLYVCRTINRPMRICKVNCCWGRFHWMMAVSDMCSRARKMDRWRRGDVMRVISSIAGRIWRSMLRVVGIMIVCPSFSIRDRIFRKSKMVSIWRQKSCYVVLWHRHHRKVVFACVLSVLGGGKGFEISHDTLQNFPFSFCLSCFHKNLQKFTHFFYDIFF